jgi:hypothetical protein
VKQVVQARLDRKEKKVLAVHEATLVKAASMHLECAANQANPDFQDNLAGMDHQVRRELTDGRAIRATRFVFLHSR